MNHQSTVNFLELCKGVKEIEIPIIQRDYAQGRMSAQTKKIREEFIVYLQNSLQNNTPVELDFVYGTKQEKFVPLDGQQRLTTLFLLYWYIAQKEGKLGEIKENVHFVYETRITSRDFCKQLIDNEIDVKNGRLSDTIQNASWFFIAWRNDPTISAMLTMLDAIKEKFNDDEAYWNKLHLITFHFLDLETFKLTEDLYIKMNARGKQLTSFEKFKARLEKKITDEGWDSVKSATDTFAHKADTSWTDLFWSYRKDGYKIDEAFLRFISINLVCSMAISQPSERISLIFNDYQEVRAEDFNAESYQYITDVLNIYSGKDDYTRQFLLLPHIPANIPNANLFEAIVIKPTWLSVAFFYAQTTYFLKVSSFDASKFDDWMRFTRNILMNSTLAKETKGFDSAIKFIDELSVGCSDIYNYLSRNTSVTSGFAGEQVTEEILKSKLIVQSPRNRAIIFETEDLEFCKGHISFALHCIDYREGQTFDAGALDTVKSVLKDMQMLFGNKFRRALLTIKNNKYYGYWATSWVFALGMPKRCLIESFGKLIEYSRKAHWRDYLKDLTNQLRSDTLDNIISTYQTTAEFTGLPEWKKMLIQDEDWLNNLCPSHYIATDEKKCYLLRITKPRKLEDCMEVA